MDVPKELRDRIDAEMNRPYLYMPGDEATSPCPISSTTETWERDPVWLDYGDGTRMVSFTGWRRTDDWRDGPYGRINWGHVRCLGQRFEIEGTRRVVGPWWAWLVEMGG